MWLISFRHHGQLGQIQHVQWKFNSFTAAEAELAPALSLFQTWSDELEVESIQELSQFPSDLSDEIQDRGLGLVCSTE